MNAIFSADSEWGIGKDNGLLVRIKDDMKRFKRFTLGNTVVMGHNTYLSLPGSRALKDRQNIVFSRDRSLSLPDAQIVRSVDELFALVGNGGDVFVIGGAQIYSLLLPYCRRAFVTLIEGSLGADVFVENLDKSGDWRLTAFSSPKECDGVKFKYATYENTRPTPERKA